MKSLPWVEKRIVNKTLIPFDFQRFMKDFKLTFEDLQESLDYSVSGTAKLLLRGTIKISKIKELETKYEKPLKKYWRIK